MPYHIKTYNVFRSRVMFGFSFIPGQSPKIMVSGYIKDGVQGRTDKESRITIALSPEELYELIRSTRAQEEIKIVHDTSKSQNTDTSSMKFLNGGMYRGNYYWSLSDGAENKRAISLSTGELAMVETLLNALIYVSYIQEERSNT